MGNKILQLPEGYDLNELSFKNNNFFKARKIYNRMIEKLGDLPHGIIIYLKPQYNISGDEIQTEYQYTTASLIIDKTRDKNDIIDIIKILLDNHCRFPTLEK